MHAISTNELFLAAMCIIFTLPYLFWRIGRTDYFAPLVVVQIIAGILLGPAIAGEIFPTYYQTIFTPDVINMLSGIATWGVMIFVWIAGMELELEKVWAHRRETFITAGLALFVPLLFGSIAALFLVQFGGWVGPNGSRWQFILGIGMACAVTALPILVLFMEKMDILREPIGKRILRYASLDDIAIWGVLAIIMLDWDRMARQIGFLLLFFPAAWAIRKGMEKIEEKDRWFISFTWLAACGFAADWAGLHFMVGAFLSGAVMESRWFNQEKMDLFRHHILLAMMPVFFLSTGLRTQWDIGGVWLFAAAILLLMASVTGKFVGVHGAARILKWEKGEASLIAWLLQTKALIMIIFVNILLDKGIITNAAFTALLLMAVASTMLTTPFATAKLARLKALIGRTN